MKKEEFTAITSYKFRTIPVDSDLSLFVLGTDTVTNTVLIKLLEKELESEGGRYFLSVSDYASLRHSFPEICGDERVTTVMKDSYEFIRAISEAGRIFTIWYLPEYYVKKEGQTIFMVCSDKRLKIMSPASTRISNYDRTVNNTDHIIRDEIYDTLYIDSSPSAERMAVLIPSVHRNPEREVEILRDLKSIAKHGRTLFGVSTAAWDYCRNLEDVEPDLTRDIYPFTHSLEEIFGKASVIVSANEGSATIAQRSGRGSVFFGKTIGKLSTGIIRCFAEQDAIEEGYRILTEKTDGDISGHVVDGRSVDSIGTEDFVPWDIGGVDRRILIVGDWAGRSRHSYLHSFIEKAGMSSSISLEVFYPEAERKYIEADTEDFPEEMRVFVYEGSHQCLGGSGGSDGSGSDRDETIREWRRILGDTEYDEIWIEEGTKLPAAAMDKYAPAATVLTVNPGEILRRISRLMMTCDIDRERMSMKRSGEVTMLDGDEFYCLGEMKGKEYYISRKAADMPYLLVKYDEKHFEELKKAIADHKNDATSVIVVDPKGVGKMAGSIAGERPSVSIPAEFVPPELMADCELFIISSDEIECTLADILDIPTQTLV